MKGIILAGGQATRIRPITDVVSKQLLPVYDKPMIYYPLSVLMLAGIKDILVISTPEYTPLFEHLLGDGSRFGIKLDYKIQKEAKGLAEAFIIGKDFVGNDPCALILGDNILWGEKLEQKLLKAVNNVQNGFASVFCRRVENPEAFGVAKFDKKTGIVSHLVEKPQKFVSNDAVIGLYFYDNRVCGFAEQITPSSRGELEITDLNNKYVEKKQLKAFPLELDSFEWKDAGSFEGLFEASRYVKEMQASGRKIAVPEEIAFSKGWLSRDRLDETAQKYKKSEYGLYLSQIQSKGHRSPETINFLSELNN